jgi:hypothetical protein
VEPRKCDVMASSLQAASSSIPVYSRTMPFGAIASASALLQLAPELFTWKRGRSCLVTPRSDGTSRTRQSRPKTTRETPLAQELRRGSILSLAGFRTEVETQLVIDRLLSEYFTPETRQA